MGAIRDTEEGFVRWLEADHLVGRSAIAALRITESYVSGRHATIRWSGFAWELRDLGSRNGTYLDGAAVTPAIPLRLHKGATLGFGQRERLWEMVDDSPPTAMATSLDADWSSIVALDQILAIPSAQAPCATIYRGGDGSWILEHLELRRPLRNHETLEVAGVRYRFSLPDAISRTSVSERAAESREVRNLQLHFTVSRDEEHVDLSLVVGTDTLVLGSRGHNYLLLLLARRRDSDQGQAAPHSECGWVYQDELLGWLTTTQERLNMDVFRIRRQFAGIGVQDPGAIIERRNGTRQLRIGSGRISIKTG